MRTKAVYYHLVETFLGDVGVVWQTGGDTASVVRVMLPHAGIPTAGRIMTAHPGAAPRSHTNLKEIFEDIEALLGGDRVNFSLDGVETDRLHGFQRRVLLETMRIPRGRVTSYGALAEAIHAPGAARAVGTALANNPFPIVIPCHRVVKADGFVGRFGGGTDMKKKLLRLEGVEMDDRGRIAPAFFR